MPRSGIVRPQRVSVRPTGSWFAALWFDEPDQHGSLDLACSDQAVALCSHDRSLERLAACVRFLPRGAISGVLLVEFGPDQIEGAGLHHWAIGEGPDVLAVLGEHFCKAALQQPQRLRPGLVL